MTHSRSHSQNVMELSFDLALSLSNSQSGFITRTPLLALVGEMKTMSGHTTQLHLHERQKMSTALPRVLWKILEGNIVKSLRMHVGYVETICVERLNSYSFIDVRQGGNYIS